MVLLGTAETGALLALPALGGRLAGHVLDAAGASPLPAALLLGLALAGAAALRALSAVVSGRTAAAILAGLRTRVHDHLQSLPLAVHQRHAQGDLLALATFEIARLGDFLAVTLVGLPAQLLTALGAVVLMARIDPGLALAVPLAVPVFFLALRVAGRRLRALAQRTQEAEADLVAAAAEDLALLPAIRSFVREDAASARFARRAERVRELEARENDIQATLSPLTGLVAGLGAVALLALSGRGLRAGTTSPAEMVSLFLYAALLTRPVADLALVYGRVQAARGILARLGALLDEAPEPGHDAPLRMARAQGDIAFEDLRFAHPDREEALRGVALSVRAGETLALTGPNGAGKSTMIALLLRFMDPSGGAVRLDGTDIRDIRLADLRRQIGWVPQCPLLLDASVRDNIAFGLEGATDAQVERAARLAQAHDMILSLPQGYATRIGENGVRLSGGQGQRIALARALIADPPVLVLDEATSMFDLDAEAAFVAAAAAALRDRTVILVTHRPAMLALADRIVTLEDGRIVAQRAAA
nr:ABC transporter ATP-binding protein [Rubellimicrobium aerolatum]